MFGVLKKRLKDSLGVWCYLHMFLQFLEDGRCYKNNLEAIMCYLGVIGGVLVLSVLFVGAFNTTFHIIDLILYIYC